MKTITYTQARANLAKSMQEICDNHDHMVITRQGFPAVVMLSLEEYNAIEETAYLLRNPQNAKRLMQSQNSVNWHMGKWVLSLVFQRKKQLRAGAEQPALHRIQLLDGGLQRLPDVGPVRRV